MSEPGPLMGICPSEVAGRVADVRCRFAKGLWSSGQAVFITLFPWAANEPYSLTT